MRSGVFPGPVCHALHGKLLLQGTTTHMPTARTSASLVSMYSASDSASPAISIPCASLPSEASQQNALYRRRDGEVIGHRVATGMG